MCSYFTYPFCDLRKKTSRGAGSEEKGIVFASKKKPTKTHKPSSPENTSQTITALSKAEKHQCHWFKDTNKASFITKRHNSLFARVLQLDNAYRHTTFQGVVLVFGRLFWFLLGIFWFILVF